MSLGADPGHRRPRWVTVVVVAAVVLIVLFVVLWAVGGSHGPGRHMSSAGTPEALLLGGAAVTADA